MQFTTTEKKSARMGLPFIKSDCFSKILNFTWYNKRRPRLSKSFLMQYKTIEDYSCRWFSKTQQWKWKIIRSGDGCSRRNVANHFRVAKKVIDVFRFFLAKFYRFISVTFCFLLSLALFFSKLFSKDSKFFSKTEFLISLLWGSENIKHILWYFNLVLTWW